MTVTLADVDGTVPGVAMLISADLSQGEDAKPLISTIVEDADHPDPQLCAEGLWEGIKDDWPGWSMTIMCNERAKYLTANRRTRHLIGEPAWDSPQEYLDELIADKRH